MNDLLRIRSLSKHYDGFDLKDVDLTVPAGSVVGFVGSNGAGKTTTIKAALGLIFPRRRLHRAVRSERGRPRQCENRPSGPSSASGGARRVLVSRGDDRGGRGRAHVLQLRRLETCGLRAAPRQFELPKDRAVKDLSRGMGMKLSLALRALARPPTCSSWTRPQPASIRSHRDEALDILRAYMRDERHGILMSSHITSDPREDSRLRGVHRRGARRVSPWRRTPSPILPASPTAAPPISSA